MKKSRFGPTSLAELVHQLILGQESCIFSGSDQTAFVIKSSSVATPVKLLT